MVLEEFEISSSASTGLNPVSNFYKMPMPREVRRGSNIVFRLRFKNGIFDTVGFSRYSIVDVLPSSRPIRNEQRESAEQKFDKELAGSWSPRESRSLPALERLINLAISDSFSGTR